MNIYPWEAIKDGRNIIPVNEELDASKRLRWGVLSKDRSPSLLYRVASGDRDIDELPKLYGISVFYDENTEDKYLVFRLNEAGFQDIFYQFCLMLIKSIHSGQDASDISQLLINRCWRWHSFLDKGINSKLSLSKQQGLMGELIILLFWLENLSVDNDIISSWQGPLGEPQDFVFENARLEVKSSQATQSHLLNISSEYQLDMNLQQPIFLGHCILNKSSNDEGLSLEQIINKIEKRIANKTPRSLGIFHERLSAMGFTWQEDYSSPKWLETERFWYKITSEFPYINPSMLGDGLSNVRYCISTSKISKFLISERILLDHLQS